MNVTYRPLSLGMIQKISSQYICLGPLQNYILKPKRNRDRSEVGLFRNPTQKFQAHSNDTKRARQPEGETRKNASRRRAPTEQALNGQDVTSKSSLYLFNTYLLSPRQVPDTIDICTEDTAMNKRTRFISWGSFHSQ